MSQRIASMQLQLTCLIVSRDQGFIAQAQQMIAGDITEVYVATSWREANRLAEEALVNMVVWDPEMGLGEK
jgi:hypothetical protein